MIRRCRRRHGDEGATLILVLIIITVLATVMGVILSQEDTAVRSTVALRDQAADVYSADGATQAVLNGVKTSGINCSNPTNPTGVTLGSSATPFYVPTSSQQGAINAYAQCTPDPVQGASTTVSTSTPPAVTTVNTVTPAPITSTAVALGASDPTLPSYAVLTTGNTANDFGLDFSTSAGNSILCIENGSVGSNRDINASGSGQILAVRLAGTGTPGGACTTGTGVSANNGKLVVTAEGQCKGTFTPTACTPSSPDIPTPAAPPLTNPIAADNPAPVCVTKGNGQGSQTTYAAFTPGLYTDSSQLNSPCGTTANAIVEWLTPGTYYFNFSTAWTWPTTLIGGTPITSTGATINGLDATKSNTLDKLSNAAAAPKSCDAPAPNKAVQGVQLVFGGGSAVTANSGTTADICATSSTGAPPVAIYGLQNSVNIARSVGPAYTMPAETLCSPSSCNGSSLIATAQNGQPEMYFHGYVYAPNAELLLTLKNSPGQVFNWGVVVRNLRLFVNGVSPTTAFVQLPSPDTGAQPEVTTTTPSAYPSTTVSTPAPVVSTSTTYTIRYINVWTCTVSSLQSSGQSQCPSNGRPNVQVRVLTNGSSMQVLSWNTLH